MVFNKDLGQYQRQDKFHVETSTPFFFNCFTTDLALESNGLFSMYKVFNEVIFPIDSGRVSCENPHRKTRF